MKNLYILYFLLLAIGLKAQEGTNQKITVQNFRLEENAINFFTKNKGLQCKFDVHFSEIISDFSNRSYKISWQLKDATGKTVFDSKFASGFHDKTTYARASKPYNDDAATSTVDDDVKLFIDYKDLDLSDGEQKLTLVLDAINGIKNFPAFYEKEITFSFKKIIIIPFEQQEFGIENLVFEQEVEGFGVGLGVNMNFNLLTKYGPDQTNEKDYTLTWKFLSADQKTLFHSKEASSIHHDDETCRVSNLKKQQSGKYIEKCKTFTEYRDLQLSGEQEIIVLIYCTTKGHTARQIFEQKVKVVFPEMHDYKEQEFTINNIKATAAVEEGANGVQVDFSCLLKHRLVISKEGLGNTYYLYVKIKKEGKLIYECKPNEKSIWDIGSNQLIRVVADGKVAKPSLKFFIPYYLLDSKEGKQTVSITLHATDKKGVSDFGTLETVTLDFDKPKRLNGDLAIANVEVTHRAFDAKFLNNYTKRKPDVKWYIMIGGTSTYCSGTKENDYYGYDGTANFYLSEGDKIYIKVVDNDNYLNGDDWIGQIEIPYGSHPNKKGLKKGEILNIDYEFEIKNK